MLYKTLVFPARIALNFYCRKLVINNKAILKECGPLLIAANHPNSFLDAIILATVFKSPVYSLARGDAFASRLITRLLEAMNMLPVYRVSEGVENLENNYTTFSICQQLFKENKIVLIFSEGRCINEWHLRPLKKGTARLALTAWEQQVNLKVLPLGINYSSFRIFGKIVHLNFGDYINNTDVTLQTVNAKSINEFNYLLQRQLSQLVYEIAPGDVNSLRNHFPENISLIKKVLLFPFAVAGWLLHAPLYFTIRRLIKYRAKDHFDSLMVSMLFIAYPWYVLIITLLLFAFSNCAEAWWMLAVFPFTALCLLHTKNIYPKNNFQQGS